MTNDHQHIVNEYTDFIGNKDFPCIGAKAALAKGRLHCMVAGDMACPFHDKSILDYLYNFVDEYRNATGNFHSAAVIFTGPQNITESIFETFLWQRLQSLANMDGNNYSYDSRVSPDPESPDFSFSLKEEAFFIIGMHPSSSRAARRFKYPALIFNPHAQFEELKQANKYDMMRQAVRKRDTAFSGSVNPMLSDYGRTSEIQQYSGRHYKTPLQCPLKINNATT